VTDVVTERVVLVPGVASLTAADGTTHLVRSVHRQCLGRLSDAQREVLSRLAAGPCPAHALTGDGQIDGGDLLGLLRAGGWLTTVVSVGEKPCYDLVPVRPAPAERAPTGPAAQRPMVTGRWRLSRFVALRPLAGQLVLQSPLAWCDLVVRDGRIAAALAALAGPAATVANLPAELGRRLLNDLRRTGLAVAEDAEQDLTHRQWSAHELVFHEHTRIGLRTAPAPFGATWWADGQFPPPPAHRPTHPGTPVGLPSPTPPDDTPWHVVLHTRRSIRAYDETAPLDLPQLATFLHRVAAVRATLPGPGGEQVDRAAPAAGAIHELELYLAVRLVAGLDPGLYHYDAHEHRLRLVTPDGGPVRRLLADARMGMGVPAAPQVLVVLAARFGRLMWKYQALSYALLLKDVGVMLHQMYLVATALGLAPCALGTGDSAAFAAATGLDVLDECSVGEFALGSRVRP
jgi:SagB-type dehydrogenase family enzyme